MSLKNPVTPGIDAGTVRLVAQRLNHYATPGILYKVKPNVMKVPGHNMFVSSNCSLSHNFK